MSGEPRAGREVEEVAQIETARVNHYEVLGLAPGVGPSEIRQAFEHLSAVYDADSLALYSLASPEEQRQALEEVREAHRVLSDPELRRAYDDEMGFQTPPNEEPAQQHLALGPEPGRGWPIRSTTDGEGRADGPQPSSEAAADEEEVIQLDDADVVEVLEPTEPALPPIDGETEFDGALLAALREARGLSRREVWERTRISVAHIQNIEEENFHLLPSRVFLRGFLLNLAKELGLDPARVVETYLRRFEAARGG